MVTPEAPSPVIAVCSNKGGVGKTTVSTNLAIYLRALREDLPVLLVGLDDQRVLDRMFELTPQEGPAPNLKHAWARRSFEGILQLGQYGVHFVPSPPDTALIKGRAEDPRTLRRMIERTAWEGIVVLDTKSDYEALTLNAIHAADRVIIPVADRSSLDEAGKLFDLLDRARLPSDRGRILLTLGDLRSRVGDDGRDLLHLLLEEIDRRGWPRYDTVLSRSPRVEALNSAEGRPRSILHHGRGTAAHRQMRTLAEEVLRELGLSTRERRHLRVAVGARPAPGPFESAAASLGALGSDWKSLLLRGGRGRRT